MPGKRVREAPWVGYRRSKSFDVTLFIEQDAPQKIAAVAHGMMNRNANDSQGVTRLNDISVTTHRLQ